MLAGQVSNRNMYLCMFQNVFEGTVHVLQHTWVHRHTLVFQNGDLLMYTLEGVSSVANFITAYEESQ